MPAGEGESAVKVTLDSAEFLGELRKMATELKKTSDDGKKNFKGIGAGIDAAKGKMREMAGTAKTALKAVVSLGGTFSFAQGIRGAAALDARMRALAFRIEVATKKGIDHRDLQVELDRAGAKTSRTTEEMATAFDTVFSATKDLQFTRDVLGAIGDTATATGEEIDTVATVAQQMQRKFGIASKDIRQSLAEVFESAQQGGPSFSDFARTIDTVGAALIQSGLKGQNAMRFLMGALNETDAQFGSLGQQVTGIQNLLLNLQQTNRLKTIAKNLAIPASQLLNEKDFLGVLHRIMGQGQKGLDQLKANFVGPEEQKALRVLFTDPFEGALERAKASGLKGKDAIDQALRVLDDRIGEFGKSTLTAADIQKRAAKEAEQPQAQVRKALETLQKSFTQPEIIQGINDLAKMLPGVASALGSFLSFAAKHPILAGTLGIGANVGQAFLQGFVREAVAKGVAQKVLEGHAKGAVDVAKKVLTAHIAGGSKLKGAMMAGGVLAAAAIAAAYAKQAIDEAADEDAKTTGGLSAARAKAASRTGSIAKQEAEAKQLEKAIAEKRKSESGTITKLGKGAASLFGGEGSALTFEKDQDEIARAERDLREKRAHIEQLKNPPPSAAPTAAAPAGPAKVALDSMASRLIATATADAMGARVLNVRLVNTPGGIGASARSYGGRGPMTLPAPAQGGGV